MRTTSIIRRQKASEYKMAKRRYRQLIHPGTFTFQHLREGTWQYGDNGFQPPALSLGKPSMVFWGCKTSPWCTSCIFLWLGWKVPPCRSLSRRCHRWSLFPWAPRCGRSAWSRPSCLDGWRSFCDSNIWTIPIILHILHISQLMR